MVSEEGVDSTDWRDWENFCRVAQAGSFTGASDLARMPKSSISASVARLERQLGLRLLERTTRRVRVTEMGQSLVARAAPLLEALRDVEAEARSRVNEVSGTLRVSAPYESSWMHLSPALPKLLRAYPKLVVEIDDCRELPDLLAERYDVAFVKTATQLPDSSMVSRRVVAVDRAFYAAPSLIAIHGMPRTHADLDTWPAVVDADDQFWEFVVDGNEVARIVVHPRVRTANAEVRVRAAIDGIGMVRLPPSYVERNVEPGKLKRILPDAVSSSIKVYAVTPARRLMPAKVRALLSAIEGKS